MVQDASETVTRTQIDAHHRADRREPADPQPHRPVQRPEVDLVEAEHAVDRVEQAAGLALAAWLLAACTPTVKVEAPDKPIEINMNVNIKHEILVKVERAVEEMFESEEIF